MAAKNSQVLSVVVTIPNQAHNPFADTKDQRLLAMICGIVNINSSKALTSYNRRTRAAEVRFDYSYPRAAKKAAERAALVPGAVVQVVSNAA